MSIKNKETFIRLLPDSGNDFLGTILLLIICAARDTQEYLSVCVVIIITLFCQGTWGHYVAHFELFARSKSGKSSLGCQKMAEFVTVYNFQVAHISTELKNYTHSRF